MKIIPLLLTVTLVAAGLTTSCQSPKAFSPSRSVAPQTTQNDLVSTNLAPASRILMIDPSSMPVGGGHATLIIGPLQRADGVYRGDYQLKVFPYVFENEKGRLAIVVSDESLAGINQGNVVAIIGTATTSGKGGTSRHIDATATPVDRNCGTLRLWFMAENRKMIFEPAYHLAANGVVVLAQTPETKP